MEVEVEIELELELELGLPAAARVGVSQVVHKLFIKAVHNSSVQNSVHRHL